MEQYMAFCTANNLDPNKRESQKAHKASLSPQEGGRRVYNAKTNTVIALGKGPDGEQLFRTASGIETRDIPQSAATQRWLMETEDGATDVLIFASAGEVFLTQ